MTKEDLINITLKQLLESSKLSPECFKMEDPELGDITNGSCSIMWRYRIEIDGNNLPDPNNAARTIVISYNFIMKSMTCFIFMKEINYFSSVSNPDATARVMFNVPWFHASYWKFMKLRKTIFLAYKEKENLSYLSKLYSIFPTMGDDDLLK